MSNTYSCIIVDDEEYAIGLLAESISGLYNNIDIIGKYTSWDEGLEAIKSSKADILFLDVSINGKNGMDILKMVPNVEMEIIFVTAYSEYALEAFKYSATGYLVKPVGDKDLSIAIDKAIERIKNKRNAKLNSSGTLGSNKVAIPSGKGVNYFDVNEIIYFEAVANYTKVVTRTGDILSNANIGKYAYLSDTFPFFAAHRSYIINLNCVVRYESPGIVIMTNKVEIPLSRSVREDFLNRFNNIHSKME
jgi:two-component system LytT family response regulator